MHVADGAQCNTSARIEDLQQFVIAVAATEVVLNLPEHLARGGLDGKIRLVVDEILVFRFVMLALCNAVATDLAFLWQHLVVGSHDFAQCHITAAEGDDVPVAGDIQPRLVIAALDVVTAVYSKKFRVDGA